MKPRWAYAIACTSAAAVSALLTRLVNDQPIRTDAAPIATAIFGAFLASFTIGNALRGSFLSNSGKRVPYSMRARWIYGVIAAVIIIAFALGLPRFYAWHMQEFHDAHVQHHLDRAPARPAREAHGSVVARLR